MMQEWEKAYFRNDEEKEAFDKKFYADPEIVKLKQKADDAQRRNDFIQAIQLNKRIDAVRLKVMTKLAERNQETSVCLAKLGLTQGDEQNICNWSVAMYVISDLLESYCLDIDKTLQKYDPSLSFKQFADLQKVLKESKQNLARLSHTTTMLDHMVWGDEVDKFKEQLDKKVEKIRNTISKAEKNRSKGKKTA